MHQITSEQQQLLQQNLLTEFMQLKEKVKARLTASSKQYLNDLVKDVDSMNADTLIDSLIHSESHSLNLYKTQIQSIDAALQGIELGLYGLCSDCEVEIEIEELFKCPTKQRCPACEIKYQQQKVKGYKL
ncbi:TraR/DksA C4-type zinc finger protein [uncultured Psychromonas sp.]|uniref:TraR/DksA C4-type zinc finger protein n=1 Tax=uncultured Psychromonas sp. TaxID=173974 RepID=UPI00263630A7|nr:TraR/DksA C4-type zinc finger protein [uncultured Psychromonas sp.]